MVKHKEKAADYVAGSIVVDKIIASPKSIAQREVYVDDDNLTSTKIPLPYLPDPLSRGAAFRFYDQFGQPLSTQDAGKLGVDWKPPVQLCPFYRDNAAWPDPLSFRIVLDKTNQEKITWTWEEKSGLLRVCLPKADTLRVRLSSYFQRDTVAKKDPLQLMGIWQWANETSSQLDEDDARQGRHWMLTPFKEIVLVHAVQQPLKAPLFSQLIPIKKFDDTFVTFQAKVVIDGRSTSKLDVFAEWYEPVDPRPNGDLPSSPDEQEEKHPDRTQYDDWIHRKVHVFEIPINLAPLDLPTQSTGPQTAIAYAKTDIPSASWTISDAPNKVGTAAGKDANLLRHEFHDTKHREVKYYAIATTRFQEYFRTESASGKPGTTNEGMFTLSGEQYPPEQYVNILSSARPAAPKLLYVIPTFKWNLPIFHLDPGGGTHSRIGGGLRVYMERPWWSSGEGEMLGVVLQPGSQSIVDNSSILDSFVTRWARDPIWSSEAIPDYPTITDFVILWDLVRTEQGLTLDEMPKSKFDVVAYPVQYDNERDLWYSDIQMNPRGSYYPFVRLALARYQPDSVRDSAKNYCLSHVILADFVQLAPDRTASVVHAGPILNVAVTGVSHKPDYVNVPDRSAPVMNDNQVEAWIEQHDPNVKDQDLGWAAISKTLLNASLMTGGTVRTWQGAVNIPTQQRWPGQPLRLVIREYELFASDAEPSSFDDGKVVGAEGAKMRRRLVYADIFSIQ